jgi:7-cyano-7-deazaguanine synthase
VLLSGGLDSTVALAMAIERRPVGLALFFDYRQHAAAREAAAAERIAAHYAIEFETVPLPWLGSLSSSVLISGKGEPPQHSPASLDEAGGERFPTGIWIENRNAILVMIAAAFAAERGLGHVVTGFNAEEAASFPDNSAAFIDAVNAVLSFGVSSPVELVSPTIGMRKRAVVAEGIRLAVPWPLIWSCYRGDETMCGSCESCRRLRRAVSGTAAQRHVHFSKEPG